MKFIKGNYYKIIDNLTKEIVACGKLNNLKYKISCDRAMKVITYDIPYVTFDETWFFNTNSDKFKIEETDEKQEYKINVPKNYVVHDLKANTWTKTDVYREHDIDELDLEVKDLVFALNSAGLKTISSCCGHGIENLFVDILFENFIQLEKMIQIIEKRFGSEFILTSWFSHNNTNHNCIQLRLVSIDIGEPAYLAAKKLSKVFNLLGQFF